MLFYARKLQQLFALLLVFCLLPLPSAFAANAASTSYSLNEDSVKNLTLRGGGIRGETVVFAIQAQPSHGTVTLSGQTAQYTPVANYNGSDSFTFIVTGSSSGASAPATASLTVNAVNDAPVANSVVLTTDEDQPLTAQFGGTDVDGDRLYCYALSAQGGTFTVDANSCVGTFTPSAHFEGTASLSYRVFDGKTYSSSLTLPITVNPVNNAPVAYDVSRTLSEDSSVTFNLQATDSDGDSLFYSVDSPIHGTLTTNGASISYTPDANYSGSDSFTYIASDGTLLSNMATVSFTVNAVNDRPNPDAVTATTDYLTPVVLTLSASDVDGDALSYEVRSNPPFGTVSDLSGTQITYTPMSGYEGTVSFNFIVSDGKLSSTGTVTVTVTDVPQAPELTVATPEGMVVPIVLPHHDAQGGALRLLSWQNPDHGHLSRTTDGWTYSPDVGFVGVDVFDFVLEMDGVAVPSLGRVNVTPNTGIPQTPIVQWGLNFMNLMNESNDGVTEDLDALVDLGVQVVRQLGAGDITWGNVEVAGQERDPSSVAAVRAIFQDHGIQVDNTLFQNLNASCTPPEYDATDPSQLVEEVTEECALYLAYAADYAAQVTPVSDPIYFEPGNELFHWVTNPNYTVSEQAAVTGYAMDTMLQTLSNLGRRGVVRAPSIMIDSEMTWDWWHEFTQALESPDIPGAYADLTYENYHYYASDENFLENWNAFEQAGMWELPKLMALTEFGYSDDPTTTRVPDASPYNKALRMARLAVMAWGEGNASLYWHTLWNNTDNQENGIRGTGLIDPNTGVYTPAAYTYRLISHELVPFVQVTKLSTDDVHLYQFVTSEGAIKYVVWGVGTLSVPEGMTESTVMVAEDGNFVWNSLTPGQNLDLTELPLLLK